MELVKHYIDLSKPMSRKSTNGYNIGVASNGISTVEFMYGEISYTARREAVPLYSLGNPQPVSFSFNRQREIEFSIEVLIDSHELFQMFKKDNERLHIKTDRFEVFEATVDDVLQIDLNMVTVKLISHGDFKVFQNK